MHNSWHDVLMEKKYRFYEMWLSLCELFFVIVPSNIMEVVEISDRQMCFIVGFFKGKCNVVSLKKLNVVKKFI